MNFLSAPDFYNSDYNVALYCQKNNRNRPFTTHSGIVIKYNGVIYKFHFAWHHSLMLESSMPHDCIFVGLERYRQINDTRGWNINSLLKSVTAVKRNNENLPYGLQFHNFLRFSENAPLLLSGKAVGLTCSTFILLFFKSFDKELVKVETWKYRRMEDLKWKKFVIGMMKKYNVPKEHITLVENEKVIYRFKPEEVVSSPLKIPANFGFCLKKGNSIYNKLRYVA